MFGKDNRIMDGAKLDLSNPKATVILPPIPSTSVGLTALTSPFLSITPPPAPGASLIDLAFNKQAPGMFLAGPVAGPQAVPVFRHIAVADIAGIGGTFQPLNSALTAISIGLWPGATSITTLGTIATGTWQATPVGAIYGGTGQNTYVLGDTLYASAANTLSRLAGNITASRNFLRQTGTGAVSAAPAWDTLLITDLITPNALGWLHNDGAGGLAWSTPALAAHDILSATHTDTVAASVVLGDVIFGNATPKWERLAGNTTLVRQFLRQLGTGLISASPAWDTVTKTDVGLSSVTNDAQAIAGAVGSSGLTMNTNRLLGRTTALAGAIEEIQVSTGLSLLAGVLTATGSGGTVTSVAAGTGLTATPSPIVGAGTMAVAGALSTLYSLADAAGWLHSNGSNVFAWSTPSYSDVGAAPAFVSGTANFVWATPNGIAGVPSLRALVAADIPALSYLAGVTSDSPLTGAGTAGSHLTFSAQTAAYVLAGPATGGAVAPTFRALVATDIPALSYDALGAAAAVTPTTLGLVIGTNTQAHSGKLDTFSALADAAGWLHSNGGGVYAWSTPSYSDVGAAPAFVSGTANFVWATPNGLAGVPSLRALVAADIPALSYLAGVTSDAPLSGAGTAGSHLVIAAVDSTHAGYIPASGTPLARNFLRAAITTGAVAWDTLTSSDVGLSAVTNDAQTKASIVPNTAPAAGQILVGNAGGTAYAAQTMGTDATLSSAGALTIANAAVTLAKMANMATASLIYRKTAGAGAPEVNTLATLKTDLGLTGTNSGDQTITLTGNVTGSGTGSFAATIASSAVTLAMMANMATASLIYRKTAGAGAPEVNTLATLKTDLAFAVGDLAAIANNTVLGNTSGGVAAPSVLTAAVLTSLTAPAAGNLTLAAGAGNRSVILTPTGTGGVGIGTTAPGAQLEVKTTSLFGTIVDQLFLNNTPSGGDATQPTGCGGLKFMAGGYDFGAIRIIQTSPANAWTSRMAFYTMNGYGGALIERMAIDNSGNVGIGTTAPGSKLSIVGLPTSSAGLSAGDIWVDTTGGLNILKIK